MGGHEPDKHRQSFGANWNLDHTKGSYYPAGKAPQPGQDPKLYILVEGDTELVVTNAMRELKRLLAEGTAAAVDSENRAPASGRYNVI